MSTTLTPPYGTYALPAHKEAWRNKARQYKDTQIGRWRISYARKKALSGETGPFDVEVDPGVKARLYPKGNRCEKRAFAGPQAWDLPERTHLRKAIQTRNKTPFIFMDIGANVGLYSLYVNAYAQEVGREVRIIAIEPGESTAARLQDNIAASEANVEVLKLAISDKAGAGFLSGGERNRGEAKLGSDTEKAEEVVIETLPRVVKMLGLTHIDAIKIDIEGHDLPALTSFFADASEALHPALLIVETGVLPNSPIIELCLDYGYKQIGRTALNAIFKKT